MRIWVICIFAWHAKAWNYCQAEYPSPNFYQPLPNAVLKHVQVLTRHGDRVAESTFKGDDANWNCNSLLEYVTAQVDNVNIAGVKIFVNTPRKHTNTFWKGNCVLSQLTSRGAKQHLMLGSALRRLYVDRMGFMPKVLFGGVLRTRSTDVWRTKQSAASFLSGLYPAQFREQAYIPLEIRPKEVDNMLDRSKSCPKLEKMKNKMYKHAKYVAFHHKALEQVWNLPGIVRMKGLPNLVDLQDIVAARFCNGIRLPCYKGTCVTARDVIKISNSINKGYEILRFQLPQSRMVNILGFGSLLQEFRSHMLNVIMHRDTVKMHHFSGHDGTVQGILGLLFAMNGSFPPYASNIIFELWQDIQNRTGGQLRYLVRVLYNGKVLRTNWCDFEKGCPFDVFSEFIDNQILDHECAL